MKNSIKYLLLSAAALAAVSCESWLDVTPPSEIRAEAHYSSAEGFQQTLIGCYLAMGKTDLYGENLTWHMVEMLGRQYDARKNTAADDYDLDRYNYKTTKSTEVIEKVWEKSYSVIANVNDALDHIDRRKDGLDSVNYRIIKGELLAVRAYIHFDLIRLFGCSDLAGRTDLESRHTVPYLTSVDKDAAPQLTYAETLRRMIADLTEAARLLEIDPIRARYPESIYTEANVDKFYDYRYMHLNYFAVKALLARVCMWEGSDENKHTALLAALEVIDDPASVGIAGGLTLRTFTDSAKAPRPRCASRANISSRSASRTWPRRSQATSTANIRNRTASTARCASRTRSPTIFSKSRAPASPTAATNSSTTTPTTGPRGPRPLRSSISRPRRAPTTATRT